VISLAMQVLPKEIVKNFTTSLQNFAADPEFDSKMASVFGEGNDYSAWQTAFETGEFADLPKIEILDGATLQGANGAYAGSLNTIYFSSDFLQTYQDQPEVIASVFLEELGHHVDWQANDGIDTPGDEGEVFATYVRGVNLTQEKLEYLKNDIDSLNLKLASKKSINDSVLEVEQSSQVYSSSNPISSSLINTLLVFGTEFPSTPNYNPHIRDENGTTDSIDYSLSDYMENGGGQYAYPALFPIIKKFFDYDFEDQEYSDENIKSILGFNGTAQIADVSQYTTKVGNDSWPYRSFFFGSTSFSLEKFEFNISSGKKTVNNVQIVPVDEQGERRDNYDFETLNSWAKEFNERVLEPLFDPYGLILDEQPVYINFVGSTNPINGYTQEQYSQDFSAAAESVDFEFSGFDEYVTETIPFLSGIFNSIFDDPYLSYVRADDGYRVIYGSSDEDPYISPYSYKNGTLEAISNIVDYVPDIADIAVQKIVELVDTRLEEINLPEDLAGWIAENWVEAKLSTVTTAISTVETAITLLAPYLSSYLLVGGDGNDSIEGGIWSDEIQGGSGDDYGQGGLGSDKFFGGSGHDTYDDDGSVDDIFDSGNDYFDGGSGNDTFYGADGNDTAFGGENDDQLYGENGNDYLVGEGGWDYLEGGSGDDKAWGGEGNDTYDDDGSVDDIFNSGNDYFDGGSGNDTFYGADGNDTAFGGENDDKLYGEKWQ
jgi:hypothetical protein